MTPTPPDRLTDARVQEIVDHLPSNDRFAGLPRTTNIDVGVVRSILTELLAFRKAGAQPVAWRAPVNPFGQPGWSYAETEQGLIDFGHHNRQPLFAAPPPDPRDGLIERAIEALTDGQRALREATPIGWRWRWGKMGSNLAWHLSTTKPGPFPEEGYEVEALYALPLTGDANV